MRWQGYRVRKVGGGPGSVCLCVPPLVCLERRRERLAAASARVRHSTGPHEVVIQPVLWLRILVRQGLRLMLLFCARDIPRNCLDTGAAAAASRSVGFSSAVPCIAFSAAMCALTPAKRRRRPPTDALA